MINRLLVIMLMLSFHASALAVEWDELDPGQKAVLGPYKDAWSGFSDEKRQHYANGARRWAEINGDGRAQMQRRFQRWQALPEPRRRALVQQFEAFRQLSPEDQQRLRRKQREFHQLPRDEQQRLRRRYEDQRGRADKGAFEKFKTRKQRPFHPGAEKRPSRPRPPRGG